VAYVHKGFYCEILGADVCLLPADFIWGALATDIRVRRWRLQGLQPIGKQEKKFCTVSSLRHVLELSLKPVIPHTQDEMLWGLTACVKRKWKGKGWSCEDGNNRNNG
jgi:hypothetical protein